MRSRAPHRAGAFALAAIVLLPLRAGSQPPAELGPASTGICAPVEAVAPGERVGREHTEDGWHELYFTRAIYSSAQQQRFGGGYGNWAIDYPKADRQLTVVVRRLTNLDICEWEHPVSLADPDLRRFPFLYAVEVGRGGGWRLTDAELEGLRGYLAAGGFLVVDDFWGSQEWEAFEREMKRILPHRHIVELPLDHPVFRLVYRIDEILQVPNQGNARRIALGLPGATTSERDGLIPRVYGIFDDRGRLKVLINWNTDLGDAWEWAESPYYPLRFSTFAFQMAVNFITYAMTH